MVAIETAVAAITAEHKVSASALAALDGGVSSATLSKALSGQSQLSPEKELSLRQTLDAIYSLIDEYSQLPIDFNRTAKIKPLVDRRRDELRETSDPIVRRCTLIRISATSFFQRMNGENILTCPSEMTACATETPELANEIVRRLAKLGTNSRIESFGAFRRRSSMTHSLVEVGFEPAVGGKDEQSTEA
jgi:hypothetical protein